MNLGEQEARHRFAASPRAILATVCPDGRPHLVPIVFALVGEVIHTAIDQKPKGSRRLQRVVNLGHERRCSLLVDRYDADWTQLWWVRADGRAEVIDDPGPDDPGRAALIARYHAYRQRPPEGPYVRVEVARYRGWAAT